MIFIELRVLIFSCFLAGQSTFAERFEARRLSRQRAFSSGLHDVDKKKNPLSDAEKLVLAERYAKEGLRVGGDAAIGTTSGSAASVKGAPEKVPRSVGRKLKLPQSSDESDTPALKRTRGSADAASLAYLVSSPPLPPVDMSHQKEGDVLMGQGMPPAHTGPFSEDLVFRPKWRTLEKECFISQPDGAVEILQEGTLPRDRVRLGEMDVEVLMNVASQYTVASGNAMGEMVRRLKAEIREKEKEWIVSSDLRKENERLLAELETIRVERESAKADRESFRAQATEAISERDRALAFVEKASAQSLEYYNTLKTVRSSARAQEAQLNGLLAETSTLRRREEALLNNSVDACMFSYARGFTDGCCASEDAAVDLERLNMRTVADICEGKLVLNEDFSVSDAVPDTRPASALPSVPVPASPFAVIDPAPATASEIMATPTPRT